MSVAKEPAPDRRPEAEAALRADLAMFERKLMEADAKGDLETVDRYLGAMTATGRVLAALTKPPELPPER